MTTKWPGIQCCLWMTTRCVTAVSAHAGLIGSPISGASGTNGKQALRILHDEQPDVILLDLIMPDMDGFRFLAEKSQDPERQQIPVIVLSAQDPAGQPIVANLSPFTQAALYQLRRLMANIEALTQALAPQRADLRVKDAEERVTADGFADEGDRTQGGGQLLLRENGGDDDRDSTQTGMSAQTAQQFPTVDIRQHDRRP